MSEKPLKDVEDPPSTKGTKDLISHHVFMLPFKLEKPQKNVAQQVFDERDFDELIAAIGAQNQETDETTLGKWMSKSFTLERVVDYNEWEYFYDFVRDILYETGNEQQESRGGNQFIKHYEFGLPKDQKSYYKITTPKPKSHRKKEEKYNDGNTNESLRNTYSLEIDSIVLHLYYTGVGVLSFHLNNREYSAKEDILYINQYGRRVFPAFYPIPENLVGTQAAFDYMDVMEPEEDPSNKRKYQPHGKELAYAIEIDIPGYSQESQGKFSETWPSSPKAMWENHPDLNFPLPRFLQPLLGILEKSEADHQRYHLKPVLDDRMFLVCWYGNKKLSERISSNFDTSASKKEKKATDWWYKYVFADAEDLTVQHDEMRKKLLEKASYLRWSGYGSWYGVTEYSLVLLTGELDHLRQPHINASYLVTHLQTIYFRLAELTLVQRACVQKFSDDITVISRLEDLNDSSLNEDKGKEEEVALQVNQLYRRYIRFINRIYFREVTAQVQGIDLYEMLHQQSRLREAVKHLNQEIQDLHVYVRQEADRLLLKREKERRKAEEDLQKLLTILGALFVSPGLVIATYDLGFLTDCLDESLSSISLATTVIMAGVSAWLTYQALTTKRKDVRWGAFGAFLIILLLPMLAISLGYCTDEKSTSEQNPDRQDLLNSPLELIDSTGTASDTQEVPLDTSSLKE